MSRQETIVRPSGTLASLLDAEVSKMTQPNVLRTSVLRTSVLRTSLLARGRSYLSLSAVAGALCTSVALVACSPATPPQNEPEVTAEPAPIVTAEPTAEPVATTEPTTEPTTEAPASTLPPPSGRPPMTAEGKEKVTGTFGQTPAAKLTITADQSVFRIPEYALSDGILITFMVDKKPPKRAKAGVGTIYRIMAQRPPAEATSAVSSSGPKFTLRVPTGKAAAGNLAIGEISVDDKGKEVVTWKVIAPAQKEEGFATFELSDFGNTLLQITNESPQ